MRTSNASVLLLDGGDGFHRGDETHDPESIANWMEMVRLGYDAVTLGELEFKRWHVIDSLMAHTALPVVCTNVERMVGDAWAPIGERYRIVEKNGIKVGILSVISETLLNEPMLQETGTPMRLLSPMQTTREVIEILRPQADIIVLLAHVDARTLEQYATTLEGVDLVVGGHAVPQDEGPVRYGEVLVNRSGTRGQHVAITRLIVSPQNEIVDYGGINQTLTKDYPEDPEVAQRAELAADAAKERRRALADRRRREAEARREVKNAG